MSDAPKFPVVANSGVVEGAITKVGPVKSVGSKGHRKVEIVVSTGGKWPQFIPVEFFGRNVEEFTKSGADVNDEVLIAVYLKGRENGSRVYGSNDGYAIKVTAKGEPPPPPPEINAGDDEYADLPF